MQFDEFIDRHFAICIQSQKLSETFIDVFVLIRGEKLETRKDIPGQQVLPETYCNIILGLLFGWSHEQFFCFRILN